MLLQAGIGLKPSKLPWAFPIASSAAAASQPAASSAATPSPEELHWQDRQVGPQVHMLLLQAECEDVKTATNRKMT